MEQMMSYVKPELIVGAVVLYFIGIGLKQSQTIKDKYIPLILGLLGIVLCCSWLHILNILVTWYAKEKRRCEFTGVILQGDSDCAKL